MRPLGEVSLRLARRAVAAAETRAGVGIVFLVALGVWWLQALVIPLDGGRDLGTYLGAYIQLFQAHPIDLGYVLGRTPGATLIVGGLLQFAGGTLAEPVVSLLYAGSIVGWFVAARTFGTRVALLTVVVLLAYPGYGILFHELSSDSVFRTFVTDKIVRPDNGPQSRALARAVQRDLIPKQPYRAYHITLDDFFTKASPRMQVDLLARMDQPAATLPHRAGNQALAVRMNQASRWFPPPIVWLVLGIAALAFRRLRGSAAVWVPTLSGLLVILVAALGLPAEPHYSVPVAPAFVVLAVTALLAPR